MPAFDVVRRWKGRVALDRDGRRIGPVVETELLAITGAVAAGRIDDAVTRAERLAERLEHPSSRAVR